MSNKASYKNTKKILVKQKCYDCCNCRGGGSHKEEKHNSTEKSWKAHGSRSTRATHFFADTGKISNAGMALEDAPRGFGGFGVGVEKLLG